LSLADVREGVRRQSFFGVLMAIAAPMLVERTERGDQMFMAMLEGTANTFWTRTLAILPLSLPQNPCSPTQKTGRAYTDRRTVVEQAVLRLRRLSQDVGRWVRLGLIPNRGHAWINALLCGPGMPTIAVLDWDAALPDVHTRQYGRRRPRPGQRNRYGATAFRCAGRGRPTTTKPICCARHPAGR
jgi:hypothetical protein